MMSLARNDRHVLRARLRLGPGAPRHRLAASTEEALRLCSLPGENEGRAYYFRRLFVGDLPEDGDRAAWLSGFQRALLELARSAVDGRDSRAAHADAVFFPSEAEACRFVLRSILQRRSNAWFWQAVSGLPSSAASQLSASPAQHVVAIVEKLRSTPASWLAVADVVFQAVAERECVALLHLVPDAAASQWLRQLGGTTSSAVPRTSTEIHNSHADHHHTSRALKPVRFPHSVAPIIERAAATFGIEDSRVLWLASLAVVLVSPAEIENGAAIARARASLLALSAQQQSHDVPTASLQPAPVLHAPVTHEHSQLTPVSQAHSHTQVTQVHSQDEVAIDPATAAIAPSVCIGEATQGAGLYFLLNALTHLGFADHQLSQRFLAHFFLRAAQHAGIDSADPILLWANTTLDETEPEPVDTRLLRIWMLNVRRWCWRNGRISVGEIVRRSGRVTLTRIDLDVSLALDSADVRIRRIGLDLDPGWVPWFGRVVRFHYLYRGDLS